MNYRFVIRQLGLLLVVLSGALTLVACWSLADWALGDQREVYALRSLSLTVAIGLGFGWVLWRWGGTGEDFLGRREALLLVALSWLVGAAVSALPFWLWARMDPVAVAPLQGEHPFASWLSCYFEAMSGLTTTGASVLTDIEAVPKGLLLWRATTHWLGGLGIIVLFVAVLPTLGMGGKRLFQAEIAGPDKGGVRPRIKETARVLWLIYLGLTLIQIVLLRACGMAWFDAVCHTFATLATGGFSTRNASVQAYHSLGVDLVVIIFMVLAGANFALYYQLLRRRWRAAFKDPELRLYLLILLCASLLVIGVLVGRQQTDMAGQPVEPTLGQAIRHGVFQVVTIQTTTGFSTVDFDRWGFLPEAVLIGLMFIGASAGSTGGGIKVIRLLILGKILVTEIERVFRPQVVRTIKVGGAPLTPEVRQATLMYILLVVALFLAGAVLLMLFEASRGIDFVTAASASAATLNNVGPGLGLVGPTKNYGWFSGPSKAVMSLLMVVGRLEIYAILALFLPRFWRGD